MQQVCISGVRRGRIGAVEEEQEQEQGTTRKPLK
jgi:hypothetical protein